MSTARFTVPRPLQLQRVPLRAVLITGAVSYGLLVGAIIEGLPLWAIALVALLPWVPLFTFEAVWQYDHYGFMLSSERSCCYSLGTWVNTPPSWSSSS